MPDAGSGHPPAEVIIGIDVGTTAAKVTAFGLGGSLVPGGWRRTALREYPLLRPHPGWQVQQPDVIVAALFDALAEVVSSAAGSRVVALSLGSAMHGLLALDEGRRPLTPLVTWADSRARAEALDLRRQGLAAELHERSGTPVHPMSPLVKLLWMRRHETELLGQARTWIGLKDWLVHALTGTLATELSSASGTGLLDLSTGTWSAPTLELAGIGEAQLPPVLETTDVLGLSPAAAGRLGLTAGTPVVLGAADGPLGNLGTGAVAPGVAALSIGTSGAVRVVVPQPQVDSAGGLFCYALTRDAWVIGGAISNGGSAQRWAAEVFGPDGAARPGRPKERTGDDEVLALAAGVPPGSDGLVALPYLMAERAPLWDPTLTGAFFGVQSRHTRGHFVRACLEGVALQLATVVEQVDAAHPVNGVRVTGGVFRSPLWRSILTDVLDRPITVTDGAEGTARGAAALGLLGLQCAASLADAVDLLPPPAGADLRPTTPDPAATACYRRLRSDLPALLASYREAVDVLSGHLPETSVATGGNS